MIGFLVRYVSLYTVVVLFFFSFFSKTSASARERAERRARTSAEAARKKKKLRPCLHGVGDTGLVDRFLLFCVPQRVKTKETNPTRPGSPTPCKQALSLFSSSPTHTPLRWWSINPPRFFLTRAGLWWENRGSVNRLSLRWSNKTGFLNTLPPNRPLPSSFLF